MPRNGNFIDEFSAFVRGKGSPSLYVKWTAIFLVGAAMERKCWLTTTRGRQFPNEYILLVGPAGIGKSLCTTTAFEMLDDIRSPEHPFFIAPTSVTKASLIDSLVHAERRVVRPTETPPVTQFNSLTIIPNEFGVFLPAWDGDFMSVLTDLWDCGRYAETRRTKDININLPATQLSMLSATTPSYLNGLLPEGAWEHGFMSRVLIVFSAETLHVDLFSFEGMDESKRKALVADLRDIYKMYGEFTVTNEYKEAINEWMKAGGPPVPDHPKLLSYRARRAAHLLKLSMIASAAGDSDRILTIDHFAEALDWLVEVESIMPDVFKSMKTGGDGRAIEECWHFCYEKWMRHKEPVPQHLVIAFLQERVPVHSIDKIIDVMERTQLLKKQFMKNGQIGYEPKARKA